MVESVKIKRRNEVNSNRNDKQYGPGRIVQSVLQSATWLTSVYSASSQASLPPNQPH